MMRNGLVRMAVVVALSIVAVAVLAEELTLESRQSYVLAKDRIPGFEQGRDKAEGWVLDPLPPSWKETALDGVWKVKLVRDEACVDYYAVTEKSGPFDAAALAAPGASREGWLDVVVPWPLPFTKLAEAKDFKGYAYYARDVEIPVFDPAKQSVFLKFYGAGYRTDVWVDGKYVGGHAGVFCPFEFDVTAFVKPSAPASLFVRTIHTRYGLSYRGARETGIFDTVRLQLRDNLHLVKPRLVVDDAAKSVVLGYDVFNKTGTKTAELEAVIEEAKSGTVVGRFKGTLDVSSIKPLVVKVENPRYWTPDDPFLYKIVIKLDGTVENIIRFGYRVIEIKKDAAGDEHFYLNGKRFYMRAFQFNYWWCQIREMSAELRKTACINDQGRLREELLVMKFMNINTFRPHSMDPFYSETFYNLCDEMGFLVYFDWNGGSYPTGTGKSGKDDNTQTIDSLEKSIPCFVETLTALHNHPSLGFFSFQNELYDHLLPKGYSFDDVLNQYYAAQKAADMQKRPTSGSTGRPTYRHDAKVDFVDDHQYIGVYYGSWRDVEGYLKETPEMIKKKFGAALPFVNMETGEVIDFRMHPYNSHTWSPELRKELFDKDDFIKKVTEKNVERSYGRLAMNAGGLRLYLTDLPAYRERKPYLHVKRWIESFRRFHDTTDGISLNSSPSMVASYVDPDSSENLQPWPGTDDLVLTEPAYGFRMAFYPVQALLDIENPHIICGQSSAAPVRIVNDSDKDVAVDLVAQLRGADGKARELFSKKGIAVAQGAKVDLPFKLEVPADAASGKAVLEVYLLAEGRKIAENYYNISTLAAADRLAAFPAKKLALYDSSAKIFAGLGLKTTREILSSLKIPHTLIGNFDTLADYDVLVIGANSIDKTLLESGEKLNTWLLNGGRMVVFEQTVGVALPWIGDERVLLTPKSSFMENYYKKHPAFKGIEDEMLWESPGGQGGTIFSSSLELNDGFLSLAAVGSHEDVGSIKSIINNRRMGKGEYFVSMVSTVDRFGKDATITRYVENVLNYLLSNEMSPYAVEAKNTAVSIAKNMSLAAADACYIDLRPYVNRGFADETEGDKSGGWTDYGSGSDMRSMPVGRGALGGCVQFEVVDPAANGDKSCVVLAGPTREHFPAESAEIAVGAKLEKLYFLHTLMWVKAKEGETLLEYVVTYDNGEKVVVPMRNKVDIADWWMAKDYPNGQVVYRDGNKCVFTSEWVNPTPNRAITSIKAVSKGNAIPIVIAVSGKRKFSQAIDRTEAEDNRGK